jgi:glycosyltransferase involved in cell wall biosynthesis
MNFRPSLVSILMTAYNREQFIAEAIESVLASTYKNWELIIVDDCSKDNTVFVAKKYVDYDSRIKLYINEINLGDYPNRNKAASYATGDLLITVDSDDTIFKDSIQNCVNLFNQFPTARFGITNTGLSGTGVLLSATDAINDHFFKQPILMKGPGGTVINCRFFHEIGGYPVKYGPANDMYFNLKAASQTDVMLIPFECIYYRRHEGQEINNHKSYLYNSYCYLRDALVELNLPLTEVEIRWLEKKNKRRFVTNIVKNFIKTGNVLEAMTIIKLAEFSFKNFVKGVLH